MQVIILAAGCGRRLGPAAQDKPKTFLPVRGKPLLRYILDHLDERGLSDVTLVVGYQRELLMKTMGASYKSLRLAYVVSADYATTGHGYSLFLTRPAWKGGDVLLIHSDIFYDPAMIDKVLAYPQTSVTAVDPVYEQVTYEEIAVLGKDGRMTGIKRGIPKDPSIVGHCVGITRWSGELMGKLYPHTEAFLAKNGNNHNWEPVFDAFLESGGAPPMHYVLCPLPWININREADWRRAEEELYPKVYAEA